MFLKRTGQTLEYKTTFACTGVIRFIPDSALDLATKLNNSIKARAHGLFLKKNLYIVDF
jgi:hypothetical protein